MCNTSNQFQELAKDIADEVQAKEFVDEKTANKLIETALFLVAITRLNVRILTDKKSGIRDKERLEIAKHNLGLYESLVADIVRQRDE